MIIQAITEDADSFENDGWTVQRLVNSSERRTTVYLRLSPRAFVARKGELFVTARIEVDKYVYRVYEGDCPEPDEVGPRFVEQVDQFPATPDQAEAPAPSKIVALVERNAARSPGPSDISEPMIQGLGVDLDCFVASGTWSAYSGARARELLSSIADSLERDGWTVQREEGIPVSTQPKLRFVARQGTRVIDGSMSYDGATLTEFPDGCASIGPHPDWRQHFDIVEQFKQLPA